MVFGIIERVPGFLDIEGVLLRWMGVIIYINRWQKRLTSIINDMKDRHHNQF